MRSLFRGAARAELLTRLERITQESPARWGSMSAVDMVAHLNDTFRMEQMAADALKKAFGN